MIVVRRLSMLLASTSLLAACTATPPPQAAVAPIAAEAPAVAAPAGPVPVPALIEEVAIPHQSFQLANGLTVLVHEDHKAPVVAVSTWYNVGSKDEPAGKTGFAHLFEHLMFNGSENAPKDFYNYLQQIGATDYNGSTWFDRTNYYETVPKAGLERALFLESDRMGHLLGAMTQEKLDNQRGVVQNEKRQGDNQPGGLVEYVQLENLFPEGHPYRHSTIGSMADLDAASLADVKQWFVDKYGPNNAVIVLAGDITAAEARPLMEKYFGSIERGPVNTPAAADVPTLPAPKSVVMKDRVAAVQIERTWIVPGLASDQYAALDLGGEVLGGLASSRLDNALVRGEKIAVSVNACIQPFQRISMFQVSATVKPGSRSRAGRKKARRAGRRLHRQRPDRGGSAARGDARSRRPDPRPRAGRRRRRQGGRPCRRASLRRGFGLLQKVARAICERDPGGHPQGDGAVDHPPRARHPARAGRPPAL